MEKKTKILGIIFVIIIIFTLIILYARFFILKDFVVQASQECDPLENSCYVYVCDPESGEECAGDLATDTEYYEVIYKSAREIEVCNPAEEACSEISCEAENERCLIEYCSEDLIEARGAIRCSNEEDKKLLQEVEIEEMEPVQEDDGEESPV